MGVVVLFLVVGFYWVENFLYKVFYFVRRFELVGFFFYRLFFREGVGKEGWGGERCLEYEKS